MATKNKNQNQIVPMATIYMKCLYFSLSFEGHTGPVNSVSLSSCGTLMLTSGEDSTARVWVPTVKPHSLTLKGHSAAVRSAEFNPQDSTKFATASNDKSIKLWSLNHVQMKSGATKIKEHSFIASITPHTNWVS
jgi:WD40 repeat protein